MTTRPDVNVTSPVPAEAGGGAKAGKDVSVRPVTRPASGRAHKPARSRVNVTPAVVESHAAGGAKAEEGRVYSAPERLPACERVTQPPATGVKPTPAVRNGAAGGSKAGEARPPGVPQTLPASGGAAGPEAPPASGPAGGPGATYGRNARGQALPLHRARAYSHIPHRRDWSDEQHAAARRLVERVAVEHPHPLDDLMPRLAGRLLARDHPRLRHEVLLALAVLGLIPAPDLPEGDARP